MNALGLADVSVQVTGLGAIGAAGSNVAELWESAVEGRIAIQTRDFFDRQLPVYAASDPVLTPKDRRLVRNAGRSATLALVAAREAWDQAGLSSVHVDSTRIGVVLGSSRGPSDVIGKYSSRRPVRPSDSVYTTLSSVAGIVSNALGIQGCSLTVSATCTSGAAAILTAMQLIRSGELDVVLAGGIDAPLTDAILEQLASTGVLSDECGPQALRPFDLHRKGTVLGEGAAFIVLESAASALSRGDQSHAIVHAVGLSCESGTRTRPDEKGETLQRAMRGALRQALLSPKQIDLVHLHGTGTRMNDLVESRCLEAVFGLGPAQPACWASKAVTGHTLGAATLFQAVLTIEAMRASFLPATVNCFTPDPACPANLRLGKGTPQMIRSAICIASGFWGNSSCLVLGQPAQENQAGR